MKLRAGLLAFPDKTTHTAYPTPFVRENQLCGQSRDRRPKGVELLRLQVRQNPHRLVLIGTPRSATPSTYRDLSRRGSRDRFPAAFGSFQLGHRRLRRKAAVSCRYRQQSLRPRELAADVESKPQTRTRVEGCNMPNEEH